MEWMKVVRKIYLLPVMLYRSFISPILPPSCRYQPTCSAYMVEAVMKWGILRGTWMGVRRILRCHPYSKRDYLDPVPEPPKKGGRKR